MDESPKLDTTGIEVRLRFRGSSLYKMFASPRIVVNDDVRRARWGSQYFPLPPGRHSIEVHFMYFGVMKCGYNLISVNLDQDETRKVEYTSPWIVFMQGTIKDIT